MTRLRFTTFLFITFTLFCSFPISAQTGQEWIQFGETKYIKLGLNEEGIYKVNFEEIEKAGLVVSSSDRENLQLFHRGVEVSILEVTNSHILFYGEKNDGSSDSLLYRPQTARINKHYSLFSDKSYYFLTIGKSKGKRAQIVDIQSDNNFTKADWHWKTQLHTYFQEHTFFPSSSESPSLRHSYLTQGETFSDKVLKGNEEKQYTITLSDVYTESMASPKLELMINGRRNGTSSAAVSIGSAKRQLTTINFNGFEGKITHNVIPLSDISSNALSLNLTSSNPSSIYSLTYTKLEYPQKIKYNNLNIQHYKLPSTDKRGYKLELENVTQTTVSLVDITDKSQLKLIKYAIKDKQLTSFIPSIPNTSTQVLVSSEPKSIMSIASCQFSELDPSKFDYLIVTNSRLTPSAREYATYRQSANGGQYRPMIKNIVDLYDQFNYGEPSPVAIRNFVKHMVSDKKYDKQLLLIGHTVSFQTRVPRELIGVYDRNKEYETMELIPTIGYPGSDLLIVDGLNINNTENIPAIPVGRISATDNSQVLHYLNKVKTYEDMPSQDAIWQKNVLHISGGKTTSEIQSLKNVLQELEPIAQNGIVGAYPTPLIKKTLLPVEKLDISKQVNEGVGMITYFGHGSATNTDYDFGYASAVQNNYRNQNKYLFMYFNGCGVGNIFSGRYSTNLSQVDRVALSTDWLFSEDKGAIAILANSWDSYISTSGQYLKSLYPTLFNNTQNLTIGEIQLKATTQIVNNNPSEYEIANLHQTVLQGDPAIKIFSLPALDYTIDQKDGIYIKAGEENKTIAESNKLAIEIIIQNIGRNDGNENVPVDLSINYTDGQIDKYSIDIPKVAYRDTIHFALDNGKGPILRVDVNIDKDNIIVESNKLNNQASLNVDWETASQKSSYSSADFIDRIAPSIKVLTNNQLLVNGSNINSNPEFTIFVADNQALSSELKNLNFHIKECSSCDFKKITEFNYNDSQQLTLSEVQYKIGLNNLSEGSYQIMVTAEDLSENISLPYFISFGVTNEEHSTVDITAYPNPATNFVYLEVSTERYKEDSIQEIEYTIFNSQGDLISTHIEKNIKTFKNGWYWSPTSTGVFIYKIICKGTHKIHSKNGQIIVQ